MADNDLDRAEKRRFAQAFATTMRIGGAGRKRGYVIAVTAVVVISVGAAVAIGAIGPGKPAKNSDSARLSALSGTSSASPSPSVGGTRSARPGVGHPTHVVAGGGPSSGSAEGRRGATAASHSPAGSTDASVPPWSAPSTGSAQRPAEPSSTPPAPAPSTAVPVEAPVTTSGSLFTTGQLSCQSGAAVEGVWVQATDGSGWASWKPLDGGATADWWYTLPVNESYHLNVGCGGSTSSWKVTVKSSTVSGGHNSFNCYDAPGANYKSCVLR